MLLRHLVNQMLHQAARQQLQGLAEEAVRRGGTAGEAAEGQRELPPCQVGFLFSSQMEAGGLIDLLSHCRTGKGPRHREYRGMLGEISVVLAESLAPPAGRSHDAGGAAARMAGELIMRHHPAWLVSSGFASALVPEIRRGQIVMASQVLQPGGQQLEVGLEISPEVVAATPYLHVGPLASVPQQLHSPQQREELAAATGAIACDHESYPIAEVCRAQKTRFLAVHAISEARDDQLPPALEQLLEKRSTMSQIGAVVGTLLNQPKTLKEVWKLRDQGLKLSDRLATFLRGVAEQLTAPA